MTNAKKTFFTGVTAVLLVLVIELLLQAFYRATAGDFLFRRALPPIYQEDPVRCYRVKPNLAYVHKTNEFETEIYTDSHGFRSGPDRRALPERKDHGTYRILLTGPSFAFGWGVDYEEMFPRLIEEGLEIPSRRLEILNIGTPSQGPAQQLCWISAIGHRYEPDMVIHTSYGRKVGPRATECPRRLECPSVENGQLVPLNVSFGRRLKSTAKRFAIVFYAYYAYNS